MATQLQDLQAKRKELQATNPNATMLDAKNALSPTPAPIANAPVAGQAPSITPIATTPTPVTNSVHANGPSATEAQNQAIRQQNAVKVQNEIATGERPAVGTQATPEQVPQIVQEAQKETPTTPVTPIETTPPTTSTTTPTTPTPTTSSAPVITPDSNSIYTNLRSNTPLPDAVKSTQAYKDAQSRYNNFQKYASYDVNTLTTALSNGTILPGTSTWNDLMTDPVMGGKILQAKALTNGKGADYITTTQQVSDNIVSNSPTVSGMLTDGQITAEEWATATNTPEVTAKMSDVEAKKNAYDALKAKYDDVETQVKADFPGSPFADSIIADRRKSMFKDLTIASDTYNNALGTLTQLKQDAGNLFETNMKLYQEQKAIENQKAMIEYQAKVGLQSKVAEQQVADEIARQAQNDPTKAIPALIEQYTKLGVPMQRSVQEMIAEAQNEIANGGTLASYLTNLQKTIQFKPEYKRIQEIQQGQMTDFEKMQASQNFELGKMGMEQDFQMALAQAKNVTSGKLTKLDDGLYQNDNGEVFTADEIKNAKLLGNSYITKDIGEEGGECGFYASRATGMSSTPGGNSKEARTKAFSETTPQVGGMAFFGGAGYDPTYGHISIVTGVNPDGTINVKDSNYSGDKRVDERTVPASSVTGYYNNTPLAKGVGTQPTGQYTESDIELLSELANMDASARNTALKASGKTLKDVTDYMAQAKAGKIPPTESQKQAALGIISNIQGIAELDWNDAVGKFDYSRMLGLQGSEDAKTLIDNLSNASALNNLGLLKGPMSDKDIAFLKSVSSKLDTVQSNSQFENNIVQMYNIAARKAGLSEIKKLSEIPKERILPGQIAQGQTSTGAGQTSPESDAILAEWEYRNNN